MPWVRWRGSRLALSTAGRSGARIAWTTGGWYFVWTTPGTESKGVITEDVALEGGLSKQGWETEHKARERPYWCETDGTVGSQGGQSQWKRKLGAKMKVKVGLDKGQRQADGGPR